MELLHICSSLERIKYQRELRDAGMCGVMISGVPILLFSPPEADIMVYRERKEKEEQEKLFQQRKVIVTN